MAPREHRNAAEPPRRRPPPKARQSIEQPPSPPTRTHGPAAEAFDEPARTRDEAEFDPNVNSVPPQR